MRKYSTFVLTVLWNVWSLVSNKILYSNLPNNMCFSSLKVWWIYCVDNYVSITFIHRGVNTHSKLDQKSKWRVWCYLHLNFYICWKICIMNLAIMNCSCNEAWAQLYWWYIQLYVGEGLILVLVIYILIICYFLITFPFIYAMLIIFLKESLTHIQNLLKGPFCDPQPRPPLFSPKGLRFTSLYIYGTWC